MVGTIVVSLASDAGAGASSALYGFVGDRADPVRRRGWRRCVRAMYGASLSRMFGFTWNCCTTVG